MAIKYIDKAGITDIASVERVSREFFILTSLTHKNVIRLHEVLQDNQNLYLVMDFAAGGDLMSLLIREDVLPEAWVRAYAAEAAAAIAAVHAMGYIHRDLKPGK